MEITNLTIEVWSNQQADNAELQSLIAKHNQSDWVTFVADWHISDHMLVARTNGEIVGFLRYVVQPIGPDNDCPAVELSGEILKEAKVLAFAVEQKMQRQGIGRRLQGELRAQALAQGCYQIRSHSSGDNHANHELKLRLGYAVHPVERDDDKKGAYFIMPLR